MIKLRSLIKINEQTPAPPTGGAPAPLMTPPPSGGQAPEAEQPAPEPDLDSTPSPEDPGEYDWTKDFRAFEDAKNKAEAQAKKKLLDKMNKQLAGKKATVNASRGYGQPRTDHTIDQIKKISVEFWYKEWVAIVTDQNDKKYFLTPGVNIKIEDGGGDAGGEAPDAESPQEPEGAPTAPPAGGEEQPNVPPTGGSEAGASGEVPPPPAEAPVDPTAQPGTVPPAVPGQPPAPAPAVPAAPVEDPLQKKKKLAEKVISTYTIGKDISFILMEFIKKDLQNNIDIIDYVKSAKSVVAEGKRAQVTRFRLEIPVDHVISGFDSRDLQLAIKEALWSSGNIDQRFSRGSIDVSKVGRMYIMEITQETGWKS